MYIGKMDIYEARRIRLIDLIDTHAQGVDSAFAKLIGKDPSYITRCKYPEGKKGKKRISDEIIETIRLAFNYHYGFMDAYHVQDLSEKARAEYEKSSAKDKDNFNKRLNGGFELPPNSYLVNQEKLNHVPVYGKGMGGLPDRMFTDEGRLSNGHDEYGEVYSSDENAFITRVEGNSMYPRYRNNSFALVEPNTEPEIEDDVLIKVSSGKVMLKRLVSRRGGVVLASYNDPEVHNFTDDEIVWMYYVAYEVPARKIKHRL